MLDDLAKRYGASKTLTWASATRTPTPGAVISRRTASSCRATATSRRPSTAICSPMACQAASSAPATSCRGPPATSARTRSAKGRPPPLPAIRPKGLRTPRIWLARSTRMRTSCARVVSRERTRWLSTPLTTTSRYQPVRTILRQAAGVVAVRLVQLQGERRLGVPSIKADHGQAQLPQLVPVPSRQGTTLQPDAHRLGRPGVDSRGNRLRGGGALAFPDHLAATI